jgi:hypothetical protein
MRGFARVRDCLVYGLGVQEPEELGHWYAVGRADAADRDRELVSFASSYALVRPMPITAAAASRLTVGGPLRSWLMVRASILSSSWLGVRERKVWGSRGSGRREVSSALRPPPGGRP